MEKTAVIAIRDALNPNGKNETLRVIFDNGFNLSSGSDSIIWDDEKELVIGFVFDGKSGSFEAGLPIEVICSTYENIQFITANTDEANFGTLIDSIGTATSKILPAKEQLLKYFKDILDPNKNLDRGDYYNPRSK